MSTTLRFTSSVARDGGIPVSATTSVTGDNFVDISDTIPGVVTNSPYTLAVDVSQVVGLYIYSDVALTLEFNDSTSPDFTISLTAGVPIEWYTGKGTNPLSQDVESLFVTKVSSASSTFVFQVLSNT